MSWFAVGAIAPHDPQIGTGTRDLSTAARAGAAPAVHATFGGAAPRYPQARAPRRALPWLRPARQTQDHAAQSGQDIRNMRVACLMR
jgi:hypothetical protein